MSPSTGRSATAVSTGSTTVSRCCPTTGGSTGLRDPHFLVALPGDDGVLLGNLTSLGDAVGQVEAVVSLCRVGTDQVPAGLEHHQVWLVDQTGEDASPNLRFVLDDTAEAIHTLRGEGKRVFIHCVAGASRTPAVAAAYLARLQGIPSTEALDRVATAIPHHNPHNTTFLEALARS